jgi:hypothetical protein
MRAGLDESVAKANRDKCNREVVAAARSGKLCSPKDWEYIANELQRFYSSPFYHPEFETSERERQKKFSQRQIILAKALKMALVKWCNMSGTEAEEDVAEELDISVIALRKRFQREFNSAGLAYSKGKLDTYESDLGDFLASRGITHTGAFFFGLKETIIFKMEPPPAGAKTWTVGRIRLRMAVKKNT